jgi:hypothetical protein
LSAINVNPSSGTTTVGIGVLSSTPTFDGGHWLAVLLLQGALIGAFGS